MQLTFGSLFAGIGGFDLGFERAGFECRWQVEIDNYATKILEKHWPKVHRQRDIRECNASNLERVDCIIGGFPCQDISYAGRGAGLDGERSGLFFEAIRLVRELQPRAIVLENVAALLTRGLDRVLGTLAEIGYDAQWHCIPAAAVGAPHIRDRVFVLAYSSGERHWARGEQGNICKAKCGSDDGLLAKSSCSSQRASNVADADLQHGQRGSKPRQSERQEREARIESCGRSSFVADAQGFHAQGFHNRSREVELGRSSWWELEPGMGRVANGVPSRVDRLRCLGNAIVPQVAEVVARMALDRLGS